jgi:hypothetical protein
MVNEIRTSLSLADYSSWIKGRDILESNTSVVDRNAIPFRVIRRHVERNRKNPPRQNFPTAFELPDCPSSTATMTMKRKLDANDVPSPEPASENNQGENGSDFESLNLDPRLRQALIQENFSRPTLVQSKAIPLALEGKDVLGSYRAFSQLQSLC